MFTALFFVVVVVGGLIWLLFKPKTLADFGADFVELEQNVEAGVSKAAASETLVKPSAKPSADTKPAG